MADTPEWDCIVVGGGAAGLSAALVLGRARRSTLVVDAGEPSNLPAEGIGGLLGADGLPPGELYARGRDELDAYPSVEVRSGSVTGGRAGEDSLELELADGSTESARRVLLATGMDYRPPDLPGVAERWGHSVFHCPFCHGWEVRGKPLALLDPGAAAVKRALLLRAWTDSPTLLTGGPHELDSGALSQLADAGITVDERPIGELRGDGRDLSGVVFADGETLPCEGLMVATSLRQRSDLAGRLGASLAPRAPVAPDAIAVDELFATSVPGLYAAGDLSVKMPSVANAVASGSTAASGIVHSLMAD